MQEFSVWKTIPFQTGFVSELPEEGMGEWRGFYPKEREDPA